jgi:H+-translocating NAD(P) transhydrogenase subunit beta
MTSMPEMVALFNGFGGIASLLVGWAEYQRGRTARSGTPFRHPVTSLAMLIGGVTFTGSSLVAYGKLSREKIERQTGLFPARRSSTLLVLLGPRQRGAYFCLQTRRPPWLSSCRHGPPFVLGVMVVPFPSAARTCRW